MRKQQLMDNFWQALAEAHPEPDFLSHPMAANQAMNRHFTRLDELASHVERAHGEGKAREAMTYWNDQVKKALTTWDRAFLDWVAAGRPARKVPRVRRRPWERPTFHRGGKDITEQLNLL